MKPDAQTLLARVAELLASELDAGASSSYGLQQLARASGLLHVVADEFDRAVAWRVEENRALRALFQDASGKVEDAGLSAQLADAAATQDNDLRVSGVEAQNRRLRALLVELQFHCEARPGLRELDDRIWIELRHGTERRKTPLDRF